jgi:hypothetical protein
MHAVRRTLSLVAGGVTTLAVSLGAQTMSFEEYDPPSSLVVPAHRLSRAKYPFIDVHSHQSLSADYSRLAREMDAMNMRTMVNLSGRSGDALAAGVRSAQGAAPGRFVFFANLQFAGIDDPQWGANAAAQLERDVKAGAHGLKIFKNLGLDLKDRSGKRVPVDDPRLDPVWRKAGELRIPVLIHTAEPRQFFDPNDKNNERWLELKERPERARPPSEYPPWATIIAEQHRVFRRHPRTIFINAHLGWLGGDLGHLGAPEHVHGDRGGAGRARAPAAVRTSVSDQVPGSRALRQGHVPAGRVPHLLSRARDGGRVLRLLPPASCVLEDVWARPA